MRMLRDVSRPAVAAGALAGLVALVGGPTAIGALGLLVLVALVLTFPVIGVGSLLVMAPVYLLLTPYIPAGLPVSFLVLGLTLVGLACRRVLEPRVRPFRWSPVDKAAGFLLVNGLVYLPLAANLKTGIYGYHELFRMFLLYFTVRLLAPARPAAVGLLWACGLTGFAVTAYGVIQHFWHFDYIMVKYGLVESLRDYAGFNKAGIARAYSVTVSPITLGFIAMVSALGAISILASGGRRDRAFAAAPWLLAAALGAAAFSYTRSAWLGIATGTLVTATLVTRGKGRLTLLAVPAVLVALLVRFVPEVAGRLGRYALTIVSSDPTETSFHYVALLQAASFFWANKLGIGLGAASFAGFQHGEGVQIWSENTFFLVGIQTGMQGLAALLAFIGLGAWTGYRLHRTPGADTFERRVGVAVLLGFLGFSVGGMSLPALLDAASFAPLWILLALAVNAEEARAAEGPATAAASAGDPAPGPGPAPAAPVAPPLPPPACPA